ncbi:uncharacterized protein F5891DRAFT_1226714 [Suillus fuscotomentosus]|uniref:Uncharacterized protein n=1 Tax=Suillus fuscotomentosus TaxID=1912939 RepID=A0AAD4HD28_9AGAM|nr:uncharacterized protein F5891DRAFT_1226714 [Suillus fuscotomentosus]KAG1886393.1 hypothetical protein F5891DRAFT_1226714 [Suillus fuscotomentosus]
MLEDATICTAMCTLVARFGRREYIDIPFARNQGIPVNGLLVSRVPDLIKMAFTASAAYVTEIRLEGLVVLRDVIQVFCQAPDPDYPDALLLEQHQAPITAALTPAFSPDSTPEILSSAIEPVQYSLAVALSKIEVDESGNLTMGNFVDLSPESIRHVEGFYPLCVDLGTAMVCEPSSGFRPVICKPWLSSSAPISCFVLGNKILQAVANTVNRSDQNISAAILGKEGTFVNGIDSAT